MNTTHLVNKLLMLTVIFSVMLCVTAVKAELNWVRVTTEYTPPRKDSHQMIFDSERQVSMMFAGFAVDSPPLYQYNGTNWIRLEASSDWPPARSNFGMAYDASRDVVVVFGGFQGGFDYLGDTWEWDGEQWEQKFPVDSPLDRYGCTMTYVDFLDGVCLFGGYTDEHQTSNELWFWNGNDWVEFIPTSNPSTRSAAQIVCDKDREVIVLFGGTEFGWDELNDTWEWDSCNTWTEINTIDSPTGKRTHTLIFDSHRNVTVLYGGNDEPVGLSRETWEYNGVNWCKMNTPSSPSSRRAHAACFDSVRQRIVLYGGYTETGSNNETWEYYDVPPTATPTMTPIPTVTPTQTPSPTATATPADGIAVSLDLPVSPIESGDAFYLDIVVDNCAPEILTDIPMFCLLELAGTFWYHPTWTNQPAWDTLTTVPRGKTTIPIFAPFTWPSGVEAGSARFWAALTSPDMSRILGVHDVQDVVWE